MKKYVKISNKNSVGHVLLERIGFGTKRSRKDDKMVVGQWHSGFKLATPAALRLGLEIFATSNDDILGPYILELGIQELQVRHKGQEIKDMCILYKYSTGRIFESSITLSAFPEWETAIGDDSNKFYPVLREYIANARDEDSEFIIDFGSEKVEQAYDDTTVIYIEDKEEIRVMLTAYSDRYFKFMGAVPIFESRHGNIYPKSECGKTRFFNDGYLVGCKDENKWCRKSLFDYDVAGKDIVNEMRTIKNEHNYTEKAGKLFSKISSMKLLFNILSYAVKNSDSYEAKILGTIKANMMSDQFRVMCLRFWNSTFGEKTVVKYNLNTDKFVEGLGYTIAQINNDLNIFFREVGVRHSQELSDTILGGMVYREFTSEEQARFDYLCETYLRRIRYFDEWLNKFPIGIVKDPKKQCCGITNQDMDKYFIEESRFKADDQDVVNTIAHELQHCVTKYRDNTPEFTSFSDSMIAFLLIINSICLDKLEDIGVDLSQEYSDFFVDIKK